MRYLWLVVALVGCGSSNLKRIGDICTASSECDQGLVCDFANTPHACASMGSLDASELVDAAHDAVLHDARPDARPPDASIDAPVDAPVDAPPD